MVVISSNEVVNAIPRFGLGMAALGRPGYINLNRHLIFDNNNNNNNSNNQKRSSIRSVEQMKQQTNLVMDQVFRLCYQQNNNTNNQKLIPWFDCARSYGLSEQYVGEYLRANHISPNDVYVSSKWGYTYVADFNISLNDGMPHEIKDHSLRNFYKQFQESINYIGEYIKLYQIHSATFESGILTNHIVHNALNDCKDKYLWKIGLSVSGPNQSDIIYEAMKIRVNDKPLFDSIQVTYNVFEQSTQKALHDAYHAGFDIIIKEGLANGRILSHPIIIQYSKQLNCSPDSLALGCIIAQQYHQQQEALSFTPHVLSGAITSEQYQSNYDAYRIAEQFLFTRNNGSSTITTTQLLKDIMSSCQMNSETYWLERSALQWN